MTTESTETAPTETAPQRWYFLKAGDSQPPVINGVRPSWTNVGDGYSYFITSDRLIAHALIELAMKSKGGIEVSDLEGVKLKKKECSARQLAMDERRASELAFKAPGMQPLPSVRLGRPPGPTVRTATVPADFPVAGNQQPGTVIREPPQMNLLPPLPPPKAEPLPLIP